MHFPHGRLPRIARRCLSKATRWRWTVSRGRRRKSPRGNEFTLTSSGGEKISGHVELVQPPRGICLRVTRWNDALFWLTLEGAEGKIDAQIWISTFGLPQCRVDEFMKEWSSRFKKVLG